MQAICLIVSFLATATAPADTPKFEDYVVREKPPAALAAPDLASHPNGRRYRTMLRRSAKDGVTFAGHFTTLELGCGSSCVFLVIVDRVSGRVFFPRDFGGLSMVDFDEGGGFKYRKDSRLIVACGDPGEQEKPACRYYEWTGTSAKLIATLPGGRPPEPVPDGGG